MWESPFEIPVNTILEINIGFVISPAKTFHIVYTDSLNNSDIKVLSNRFFFDLKNNILILFSNEKFEGTGYIEF